MSIDPKWHPLWPQWLRNIVWLWRNPPTLFWRYPQLSLPTWNPKGGWLFLFRDKNSGYETPGEWITNPGFKYQNKDLRFVSYRGKFIEFYIGWRPSGAFGFALRHANARGSEAIK